MPKRRIFNPDSTDPFAISRTKIELFVDCPRCFYLDCRLGVKRPGFPAFTLNSAVDALLKKEFDGYRAEGTAHPIMEQYGLDAVPYVHDDLDVWRHNFTGIRFLYRPINFEVFGAVDDVWQKSDGSLIVVDYKATSTKSEITLDGPYKQAYKRQLEVYQWLLRQNGFAVSNTGYFVYANGRSSESAFHQNLKFDVVLIPYEGNDAWVEETLAAAHKCLKSEALPEANAECKYCNYRKKSLEFEQG